MKKYLLLLSLALLLFNSACFANCHASFQTTINSYSPPNVTFIDMSYDTLGGTITSWAWDFGDGQTSTLQNPVHTYAADGQYWVCLTITSSLGCTDSYCQNLNAVPPIPAVHAVMVPDSMAPPPCTAPAYIDFTYQASFIGFGPPDSAQIHVYFGDGLDSIFYRVMALQLGGVLTHQYQNSGTYYPTIIITTPSGLADTFASPPVFIGSSCGNISGKVYEDNNGNCIFDAGDVVRPNLPVYLNSNLNFMFSTNTDINGDYSFNTPSGQTYDLNLPANFGYQSHLQVACPSSGTYNIPSVPSTGNDFALSCLPAFDLEVYAGSYCLSPGFISHVYISAFNNRCNTPSGQVQVVFPPDLTPLPDSVNSYTITGNTISFPINAPDLFWNRSVPVQVSTSAVLGSSQCITITATPTAGDAVPANNTYTHCGIITGAFDPNQKTVEPKGLGAQGYIAAGTDLTYTVDFQNTGTASAVNIFILDTISQNLDISSIRILGTSHSMTWSILPGRIVRFTFDNILLPDSNADEINSHGYVAFRIQQIPNLPQLSLIYNTAGIYFDFNKPVITNYVYNTIDQNLNIENVKAESFLVSPNPASQLCQLKFIDSENRLLEIRDYLGKLIERMQLQNDVATIDLKNYENGLYFITVIKSNSIRSMQKLIIQK